MRITIPVLAIFVTLIVVVVDYQMELGIVSFLSDFFVVFLAVAILFGAIGVKTRV